MVAKKKYMVSENFLPELRRRVVYLALSTLTGKLAQSEFAGKSDGFGLHFQNPMLESRLFYEIRNYFVGGLGDCIDAP